MWAVSFLLMSFFANVCRVKGYSGARRHPRYNFAVGASKHIASQLQRSGEETKDTIVIDPKKIALLEKLGLGEEQEDKSGIPMTGAELRKDRKNVLRVKRNNEKHRAKSDVRTMKVKIIPEKAVRFSLGCGIEALTASNLLDLVKSTAPYLFPESGPRIVIEEDDDFDDLNSFAASYTSAADRLSASENRDSNDSGDEAEEFTSASASSASVTSAINSVLDASEMSAVEKSEGSSGWLRILKNSDHIPNTNTPTEDQRIDYFALCMASHFCTVATFVPTDVDSKIRGHCWMDPSPGVIEAQFKVLKNALHWDVDAVSKRNMRINEIDKLYPISGHDGEWLGVLGGAWGAFLRLGRQDLASEAEELISRELSREAAAFKYVRGLRPSVASDTALLKLAAILTHNVGDVDQGLNYWQMDANGISVFEKQKLKFSRLAHERNDRFGGEFLRAKIVYKELLSAEGHRHYPLREPKCLRMTPDLMLPLGPWFENWGRMVAMHPALSNEDRVLVTKQLLKACDPNSKQGFIPNQVGYFRALHGIASVVNLDRLSKDLDKECRAALKEHDVRLHLGLSEDAFASRLGSRARDLLANVSG